jgi:hypothetical protein
MNAVKCPDCGESFDETEFHWVTNAEGGVMYRMPCDHMVVGIWTEGVVTYGHEHAGPPDPPYHRSFWDNVDRILEDKAHEK